MGPNEVHAICSKIADGFASTPDCNEVARATRGGVEPDLADVVVVRSPEQRVLVEERVILKQPVFLDGPQTNVPLVCSGRVVEPKVEALVLVEEAGERLR